MLESFATFRRDSKEYNTTRLRPSEPQRLLRSCSETKAAPSQVEPVIEQISATAVALTFKIDEVAVRVAGIEFEGNKIFSGSYLRGQMKLVKQLGLFTTFSSKDITKEKLETDLDGCGCSCRGPRLFKARFGEPRVEDVGKVGTWVPLLGHKGQGLKIVIPVDEGRNIARAKSRSKTIPNHRRRDQAVIGLKSGDVVKGYRSSEGSRQPEEALRHKGVHSVQRWVRARVQRRRKRSG